MALLTSQNIPVTGVAATYSAVASSDTITPEANTLIYHVKNAGGSTDSVVLVVPGNTQFDQANPDVTVSVLAGTEKFIFLKAQGSLADAGVITVTHSFTTSVTAALLKVAV